MKLKKMSRRRCKKRICGGFLCRMKQLPAEGKIDEKAVFVVRALCPDFPPWRETMLSAMDRPRP